MTTVTGTPTQIVVRTEGIQGPPGPSITGLPALNSLHLTDQIAVVRNGTAFLSTIAEVLAASGGGQSSGQFDFSTAANSLIFAAVM